jgi:hypothetical protein
MKTYGRVDVKIDALMTLALVGGEWSASRPCRFSPLGINVLEALWDPEPV